MYKAFAVFWFAALFCFPCATPAQNKVLQVHHIKLPGKFPPAGIRMTVQDKTGLLWYFSNNGLYRYDGNEVLHFGMKTSPALPYLPLFFIQPDGKGNLWLAFTKGVAKFDLKKWTITPLFAKNWQYSSSLKDKDVNTIACLSKGRVYFGTSSGKLYLVKNDRLHQVADIQQPITNISEPVPGQLWLTTRKGSLVTISVKNGEHDPPRYYRIAEINGEAIYTICYDESGKFLFSTLYSGLFLGDVHKLDAHREMASGNPFGPPAKGLVKPIEAPVANLVLHSPFYLGKAVAIATGKKEQPKDIFTFDFKTEDWHLATSNSPVKFPGSKFYVSKYPDGAFVNSSNGLIRLRVSKPAISSLLYGRGSKNSIRAIYKKRDVLYVASYRDGFISYNNSTGQSKNILDSKIYSILPWNKDSLLLADEGKGLLWFEPQMDKISRIPVKPYAKKHLKRMATVLHKVNDSLVLQGSYQGLLLIDPVEGGYFPIFKDSLSDLMQNSKINAIMPLNKDVPRSLGKYIVGTNTGAFVADLNNGGVSYFMQDAPRKTRKTTIFSLLPVKEEIWMGSSGLGILAAKPSGEQTPMGWLNDRLTGQMIYSLTQLGDDVLIGTNKGLNVLHLKDSTLTYYTVNNGLPSMEFNQAAVFNNGKEAYLGTVNGIVHWTEDKGSPNNNVPRKIHVNKLTVVDRDNHKTISYNLPYLPQESIALVIPPGAKYFSIAFGKPTRENQSINYYYRLDSGEAWIKLAQKREITFVKTPPGNYQLQFAAKTPEGKLIPEKTTIPLTIKATFWQSIFFKILLILVFGGLFLLIFRYREKQKNKERNLRMKIAGDLHDEVGSSLTRIWHSAQQARMLSPPSSKKNVPGGKEKGNRLNTIAKTSHEALSTMSDMVWSIDARFDTMEELILRMKDYVYLLKNESEIPLRFQVNGSPEGRKLSQVVRQNLFLLFKEGINNAIKHGDGGGIKVCMSLEEKHIMLKVSNSYNPNGNDNNGIQGGIGLENMRRRAKNINGQLKIKKASNSYMATITI